MFGFGVARGLGDRAGVSARAEAGAGALGVAKASAARLVVVLSPFPSPSSPPSAAAAALRDSSSASWSICLSVMWAGIFGFLVFEKERKREMSKKERKK